MNHAEHLPATALTKALDGYAEWLDCHFVLGIDATDGRDSGASLLHAVAEIRRHSCPGASQLMTDLLLNHTKLSALLFDHQLKLLRGQSTESLVNSKECVSLMQRQTATVTAMRSACTSHRAFCIHTTPSAKDSAKQFVIRSVSAADPGHVQG